MIIEQLYTNTGEVFNDSLGNEFLVLSIDVETDPAVVDAPRLQQTNKLSFVDILHAPFEIDTPTLAQSHTVQSANVEALVSIDTPVLQQKHVFEGVKIESTLQVSSPYIINQTHSLSINSVYSDNYFLSAPLA